jgi:hypothetical protein
VLELLSAIAGQFFKGLFAAVLAGLERQQDRADQRTLGQQQQVSADAVAALDAARRMEAAGVQPHDVAATLGRLDRGTF